TAPGARDKHCVLCRCFGVVRAVTNNAAIGCCTDAARNWWWRIAVGVSGGDCRCDPTARAWPVSGLLFQCHGVFEPARAGAGRVFRGLSDLALDLLDQYSIRATCALSLQS